MAKHNYNEKINGADEINGNSISVNLYNREGVFVANVPVIPFQNPPEVITWGTRTFVLGDYAPRETNTDKQYREGFNYSVPVGFNGEEYKKAGG